MHGTLTTPQFQSKTSTHVHVLKEVPGVHAYVYVYMQINEAIDNDQAHLLMQLAFV